MLLRLDLEQMRGFGCSNEQCLHGRVGGGGFRQEETAGVPVRRRMPGRGQWAVPGVAWVGTVAQWG